MFSNDDSVQKTWIVYALRLEHIHVDHPLRMVCYIGQAVRTGTPDCPPSEHALSHATWESARSVFIGSYATVPEAVAALCAYRTKDAVG